jgi:hypothetical protein
MPGRRSEAQQTEQAYRKSRQDTSAVVPAHRTRNARLRVTVPPAPVTVTTSKYPPDPSPRRSRPRRTTCVPASAFIANAAAVRRLPPGLSERISMVVWYVESTWRLPMR